MIKSWIFKELRFWVVVLTGIVFFVATSVTNVWVLESLSQKGASLDKLLVIQTVIVLAGVFIAAVLCLFAHHILSLFFEKKIILKKAIRITEAMSMLHASTNPDKLSCVKFYGLKVYRVKSPLGPEPVEDLPCTAVSSFFSPMFFKMDRTDYLGSPKSCCDFEEIQETIAINKALWADNSAANSGMANETLVFERIIADLKIEKTEAKTDYSAAKAREKKLENKIAAINDHLAVLIELAHHVTKVHSPENKITKEQIKAKYMAIGKAYDINSMPDIYMEIFRKTMPKELINWGGAPSQG